MPEPQGIPTEADINGWLNDLFLPVMGGKESAGYEAAIFAFEELTGLFLYNGLCRKNRALLDIYDKRIHFDYVALISMLKKFQRDAYEVGRFSAFVERLISEGKLRAEAKNEVMGAVHRMGLRINAERPRKTRVAACFSLWMCVYRPVSIVPAAEITGPASELELFCASLNYYLASTFLMKFGEVNLGTGDDARIRLSRIKHDFTVRRVCLSTLETLYASLFRQT